MSATPTEIAAALRAMGYSAGQAEALAADPINMPRTMVEQRMKEAGLGISPRYVHPPRPLGRPPGPPREPGRMTMAPARWRARHKAELIRRFEAGELTLDEIAARFGVGAEEFEGWREHMRRGGVEALRATPARAAT